MIKTRADLYSTEESIDQLVLVSTTTDMLNSLGLPKDIYTTYDARDTAIKNTDKRGVITSDNTTLESFLNITYEEVSVDNNELSLLPYRPDGQPIYIDPDIHSYITPVMHDRKMSITFEYHSKSKSFIKAKINKLRLKTANDTMYRRHDLEYYYVVPNYVTSLLQHINNLKNTLTDRN